MPAQWLGSAEAWKALLPNLPLTALVRNLGRLSANGALTPLSAEAREIERRLADGEAIRRARLHPLSLLVALTSTRSGKGALGGLKWDALPNIVDALNDAFYLAFDNVEPAGKRIMLALDVSASMRLRPSRVCRGSRSCRFGGPGAGHGSHGAEPRDHRLHRWG